MTDIKFNPHLQNLRACMVNLSIDSQINTSCICSWIEMYAFNILRLLEKVIFFLILINAANAFGQTKQEAEDFLLENTDLYSLSCSKAIGTYWTEYDDKVAYSFDPKEVTITDRRGWVTCTTGQCITEAEVKCRNRDAKSCSSSARSKLREERGVTYTNQYVSLVNVFRIVVSEERLVKAWDFYVSQCGGRKRPVF